MDCCFYDCLWFWSQVWNALQTSHKIHKYWVHEFFVVNNWDDNSESPKQIISNILCHSWGYLPLWPNQYKSSLSSSIRCSAMGLCLLESCGNSISQSERRLILRRKERELYLILNWLCTMIWYTLISLLPHKLSVHVRCTFSVCWIYRSSLSHLQTSTNNCLKQFISLLKSLISDTIANASSLCESSLTSLLSGLTISDNTVSH